MRPIILIPARLQSSRLPEKVLADIAGKPMIQHVVDRAVASGVGRVVVAAAEREIVAVVNKSGGEAVLTDPSLPSGSDRVHAALQAVDGAGTHDVVINLQGDLPQLDPALLARVLKPLEQASFDIATAAAAITDPGEVTDPHVVKVVMAPAPLGGVARAHYFTRAAAPYGEGPFFHHIGLYAYRRAALERFVGLPPSPLETRERLEQLRALEAGLQIGVVVEAEAPYGIDTPDDLARIRQDIG